MTAERAVRSNPNLLGQIAFDLGYVNSEALERCVNLQSKSSAFAPLGLLLLENGYLTLDQLEELLRIQLLRFKSLSADLSEGGLFGQIALGRGWLTNAQLAECLRLQAAQTRAGSSLRLGQICLEKGYLTTQRFLEILRLQNKDVAECPNCHAFFDTSPASPGTPFGCSKCGNVLRSH